MRSSAAFAYLLQGLKSWFFYHLQSVWNSSSDPWDKYGIFFPIALPLIWIFFPLLLPPPTHIPCNPRDGCA